MYRDYFQTDIEDHPEDDVIDNFHDEVDISKSGEFRFDRYEFIETNMEFENHEQLSDIVDKKIFKFKYRLNNDDFQTYLRRMNRVVNRQLDRAQTRDPKIEMNLGEMLERNDREQAPGALIYKMVSGVPLSEHAHDETQPIRDYMLKESVQIYKDYYETDTEEQSFFEYLNELPNRDRLKFIDIYEDFTIPKRDGKGFVKIPKREYNPELSLFSNVALDLVDFKDRVIPLAKDAARLDGSIRYQRSTVHETKETINEGRKTFNKYLESQGMKPIKLEKDKDLLSSDEILSGEEAANIKSHHKSS